MNGQFNWFIWLASLVLLTRPSDCQRLSWPDRTTESLLDRPSNSSTLTCGHIVVDVLSLSASDVVHTNLGTGDWTASLSVHYQAFHSQVNLCKSRDQINEIDSKVLKFLDSDDQGLSLNHQRFEKTPTCHMKSINASRLFCHSFGSCFSSGYLSQPSSNVSSKSLLAK